MTDTMHATAQALVAPGKGILAADESTGTIKKRFDSIGVDSTEDSRRAYRQMLFTTPDLGEHISGAILFDETIRQSTDDGVPFVKVLEAAGSIAGIKVDTGAKPLALFPGETVTEGLDGLRERLADYRELGALREVAGNDHHRGRHTDELRDRCERARDGALRGPVPRGRHRADRRARDPDGRRPPDRSVRGGDGSHARRAVQADGGAPARPARHAAQGQHDRPWQGQRGAGRRRDDRGRDDPLPVRARPGIRARDRVPVGRHERRAGDEPARRDEPHASGG